MDRIIALASSVGMPILMDNMTAAMCHKGVGNLGYARVLVEIKAEKGLKKSIDIQYRDKENCVKGTKTVQVVYEWTLQICEHCKVFGHDFLKCNKRPKSAEEVENETKNKEKHVAENQNNKSKETSNGTGMQGSRGTNIYHYNHSNNFKNNSNNKMAQEQGKEGIRSQKVSSIGYMRQEYRRTKIVNMGNDKEKNDVNVN